MRGYGTRAILREKRLQESLDGAVNGKKLRRLKQGDKDWERQGNKLQVKI